MDAYRSTLTSIRPSATLTPTASAVREGLGIYLYANPQSAREREFNASMEEKAEAIRCRRFEQLLNEQFGFLDKEKMRMDFLDYFRKKCYKKHQKWKVVYEHFSDFCRGKCLLGEVTEDFCKRFQKYLLEGGRRDDRKGTLAHNSIAGTGQHSVPF